MGNIPRFSVNLIADKKRKKVEVGDRLKFVEVMTGMEDEFVVMKWLNGGYVQSTIYGELVKTARVRMSDGRWAVCDLVYTPKNEVEK